MIAVTPGEPAGIGPDIVLAAIGQTSARCLVIANPDVMSDRARKLGIDVPMHDFTVANEYRPGHLNLVPIATQAAVEPGALDPRNAIYVLATLERAVELCEANTCSAMVTGPVNKAVINEAGVPFTGHTEWLAQRTGANHVVMMLATTGLKVALVTTHLPLRAVADAITDDLIERTVMTLEKDLREKFGITSPRIMTLGLNPHAGESGHLGREEIEVIEPAIERLARHGTNITGPYPADTAFTPHMLERADVVLAMYHDQGLPVLKYKGFGNAANITLGLPLIRTSVDHGTATDIAGTGQADPSSLLAAIDYAEAMSSQQYKAA